MDNLIPDDVVPISFEKYIALVRDQQILRALEAAGVDNWEYYDEAIAESGVIY